MMHRPTLSGTWRIAACVLGVLSLECAASGAVVDRNVVYASPGAPDDALLLDVYRPTSGVYSGGYTIVLMHGGGYVAGDKIDFAGVANALADMGYAVVVPNYTLASPTMASFPQPVVDTLNVMRWIRTEGLALGVPDRVILGGHSAGATIALTAANVAQSALAVNFPALPASDRRGMVVDGAIGISGRYDIYWNVSVGLPGTVYWYLGMPVGATGWQSQYQAASATTYVNGCSPPTVLIHGDNDVVVPVGNTYRLNSILLAADVPVQMQIVPGGSHDIVVVGATWYQQAQRIAQAAQWINGATLSTCGRTGPGPAVGACCGVDGSCTLTEESACSHSWRGGMYCTPTACPPAGVCCVQNNCVNVVQTACEDGQWRGLGVCEISTCNDFYDTGACCRGATCQMLTSNLCTGPKTRFTAASVACNASGDLGTPCHHADYNKDEIVSVQDIFDFLGDWFSGNQFADIAGNGSGTPGVQSIFTFLSAWFTG